MVLSLEQFKNYKSNKKLFCLIGCPLGHSLSPQIHKSFFGEDCEYVLVRVEKEELEEAVGILRKKVCGFNVTIPYKSEIIKFLNYTDEKSNAYNAVNTVRVEDNKLYGYNTDAMGFVDAIDRKGFEISGNKVLVLGAGGAATALAHECAIKGGDITILSRTYEKSKNLCELVKRNINSSRVEAAHKINKEDKFDVIINTTPVGMSPDVANCAVDESIIKTARYVFDAIYNPIETTLIKIAKSYGCVCENGMYMLAAQAAYAQQIWQVSNYNKDMVEKAAQMLENYMLLNHKPIALCGFMGCGKTTVSKVLSKKIMYSCVDLDACIVKEENRSINEIFEKNGEQYFRQIETQLVCKLADKKDNIISLGGGAVLNKTSVQKLKEYGIIIYLNADIETIIKRVSQSADRPLADAENNYKKLRQLYEIRQQIYKSVCDYEIDANDTTNNIAEKIINAIREGERK